MKTRESGMPDAERWDSFFDPDFILDALGLVQNCRLVVDLGCGYGTFSIPAARRIAGTVMAMDIDPQMVAASQERAQDAGLGNLICQQRDFVAEGSGLADGSADFVMLFNILHAEDPVDLLREAHRILAPGGRVGVIHWKYDPSTPRGPSMEIRPRPEQCQAWIQVAGFQLIRPLIQLPPYHYGMVGQKEEREPHD
ncbi:MAG TPA: class I SAM-dependent methyltransferase [Anaerolineaceae bacterium]|nr:class I SAM-dependent methyltransferase [Anaerolineaceae bacterium]